MDFNNIFNTVVIIIGVIDGVASIVLATVGSIMEHRERKKRKQKEKVKIEALELVENRICQIANETDFFAPKIEEYQDSIFSAYTDMDVVAFQDLVKKELSLLEDVFQSIESIKIFISNDLMRKSQYFSVTQSTLLMNIVNEYRTDCCNSATECSKIAKSLVNHFNESIAFFQNETISFESKKAVFEQLYVEFAKSIDLLNKTLSSLNNIREDFHLLKQTLLD